MGPPASLSHYQQGQGGQPQPQQHRSHRTGAHTPSSSGRETPYQPPPIVVEGQYGVRYATDRFLGKGGFAVCYEAIRVDTGDVFALKVVQKSRLTKRSHWEKMDREIQIHKGARHRNIVQLHRSFEDDDNVYLLMELCPNDSLLHRISTSRNERLSHAASREFLAGLLAGVEFLLSRGILHRDIKPGNVLLGERDEVKLADFGLAVRQCDTQPTSLAGTPNYLAPEVLKRQGHSPRTEAWSIGCTLYCMLVGRPPFETDSLDNTYQKIAAGEFSYPIQLHHYAVDLIDALLCVNPSTRLTVSQIRMSHFMAYSVEETTREREYVREAVRELDYGSGRESEYDRQPRIRSSTHDLYAVPCSSVLLTPPQRERDSRYQHLPVTDVNANDLAPPAMYSSMPGQLQRFKSLTLLEQQPSGARESGGGGWSRGGARTAEEKRRRRSLYSTGHDSGLGSDPNLSARADLCQELDHHIDELRLFRNGGKRLRRIGETPLHVSKWVDYSNRFGFGCMLSDGAVTVKLNTGVSAVMPESQSYVRVAKHGLSGPVLGLEYRAVEREWTVEQSDASRYGDMCNMYREYMQRELMDAGVCVGGGASSASGTLPFLVTYHMFANGIVMVLSDATVQINFSSPRIKVVVSPGARGERGQRSPTVVTLMDSSRCAYSYELVSEGEECVCSSERDVLEWTRGLIQAQADAIRADVRTVTTEC